MRWNVVQGGMRVIACLCEQNAGVARCGGACWGD